MKEMPAGKFKAECLAIMDEVQARREPVMITKRGKPVAKLVPVELDAMSDPIFGFMKDEVVIHGDLVRPITPEEDWNQSWEPSN
jgi:prevent-host-death family protein